ncbi:MULTISPECIES: carbohydrate porin [Aeromonas]|uniref:carbohydrate porin n=1 Tax=Aeromonas TaxID=642 RepID=UPI00051BE5EB|nr:MULTISPECIES: carbohydrate porin [Aeromonas]MCH7373446.1 carbohydrate porin [Aeromonas sp. MR16]
MKKSICYTMVAAALALGATNSMAAEGTTTADVLATAAKNIDFFGYFRAGVAGGADGSMENNIGGDSFEKNKIGRIGNEFDNYAEVGFGTELYNENNRSVYVQTMFNMWDGDTNSSTDDSPFGWENMNMQLRNFMGLGETSWAGIRQYKSNYYIDTTDHYYWGQTTVGAGVEDMKVGPGNLSLAVLHRDLDGVIHNPSIDSEEGALEGTLIDAMNYEILYDNLSVWEKGTLAMGYRFLHADPTDAQIDNPELGEHDYADGHAFLVELKQEIGESGYNRTVLQYYLDGSALQGVQFGAADVLNGEVKDGSGFAIRNFGAIPLSADWDFTHVLTYAEADSVEQWNGDEGDGSSMAVNAGVVYHWSDITRTYLDAGYFQDDKSVNNTDYDRSGSKVTLAQALSFGRGEPELRVYTSYLDSDNSNWDDTTHSFEGHNSDDTWAVGAMVNVWW